MMLNHLVTSEISRRNFLQKGVGLSALAFGGILAKGAPASTPGPTGSRVAWAHDPRATFWEGAGYYCDFVSQERVTQMIDAGIRTLTGELVLGDAWSRVLPDYTTGQKIGIKINLNNSHRTDGSIDALPHPVIAVIGGLKAMGVAENDVWVLEPSKSVPRQVGDPILAQHPGISIWEPFWAATYGNGIRWSSAESSLIVHHAHPSLSDSPLPDQLQDIDYIINMPILKGHGGAGVTLTFKNNFGFLRMISKLHPFAYVDEADFTGDMSPLVDIYLNSHLRQKTALVVADALFAHPTTNLGAPRPWRSFGGAFPNSIFLSTDPVALDSVLFDFLHAEAAKPEKSQLYLHRAMELGLGTHEHWNDPVDKQYSLIDFRPAGLAVDRGTIDRKIRDFRKGESSADAVKNLLRQYRG